MSVCLGATNDIRPSFLILVTISFYLKLPAERNLVVQARNEQKNIDIITVQAAAIFVPVIFYIIWQFQCGFLNSGSEAARNRGTVLKWSAIFFSVASLCLIYWLFRPQKQQLYSKQLAASIL